MIRVGTEKFQLARNHSANARQKRNKLKALDIWTSLFRVTNKASLHEKDHQTRVDPH